MKKFFFIIVILLPTLAHAQQQSSPPQKTFDLKLTSDQINIVGEALMELPGKKMLPTWQAILSQLSEQNKTPPAAEEKRE